MRRVGIVAAAALCIVTACSEDGPASGSPSGTPSSATAATSTASSTAATPSSAASTTTPAQTQTTQSDRFFGPFGHLTLRLGMTAAELRATGMFSSTDVDPSAANRCVDWHPPTASGIDFVVVTMNRGLVMIDLAPPRDTNGWSTPEGVHHGSTPAEVQAAYPSFNLADVHAPHPPRVEAPGNPSADYQIGFDQTTEKVNNLALVTSSGGDCQMF